MKKVISLLLATMLTLSATACGSKTPAKTTSETPTNTTFAKEGNFVIGTSQPLTGTNALVGDATVKAIELAVKTFNEQGGINGQEVKLVTYDDQASPEEGVKVATKLVQVDKVDVVLGSLISSVVLAQGQLYNDAKIPVVGTGLSPSWMSKGWEYIFRSCVNNGFAMPALALKMKDLGIKSISVFQGQDDAAKTSAVALTDAAKANGIEVLTTESYVEGDSDFSGQVAKIINSKPEAIFISTYGPTQPMIVKQLRQFGYTGMIFNKETFAQDSIDLAGDAADQVAFLFPYVTYGSDADIKDVKDPMMVDFLNKYFAEYGKMPNHDCAYRAWDAMMVLAEGAKLAGSNEGEAIKTALSTIKDFKVLGGTLDFTQGDREGMHGIEKGFVIIDGKYTDLDEWIAAGGTKK